MSINSQWMPRSLLLLVLLGVTGLAYAQVNRSDDDTNADSAKEQEDTKAIVADAKVMQSLMVIVPSAGFLADKMTVTALKAGSVSESARQLVQILSLAEPVTLVVGGDSSAVSLATFERAIRELSGSSLTAHRVMFRGKPREVERFRLIAKQAGLDFVE